MNSVCTLCSVLLPEQTNEKASVSDQNSHKSLRIDATIIQPKQKPECAGQIVCRKFCFWILVSTLTTYKRNLREGRKGWELTYAIVHSTIAVLIRAVGTRSEGALRPCCHQITDRCIPAAERIPVTRERVASIDLHPATLLLQNLNVNVNVKMLLESCQHACELVI